MVSTIDVQLSTPFIGHANALIWREQIIGVRGIAIDPSDIKTLEERLDVAHKMETEDESGGIKARQQIGRRYCRGSACP